ncbi:MAG: class I SAM-dependent methyltransferase [Actinobacteria bacterium]|nr:MAG: class I SAM-dependent methyltransferase [Actinomycetota bacterium]
MTEATPDLKAVTQVQQKVWSEGDFAKIGNRAQIVGEHLCETVDLLSVERVLDVACGSGNTALAAARRFAEAVGVDYVPELLAHGRERAAAEGLEVEFVEGDAQALPFEDASFDVVLSTFGAMFAPDQEQTAAELLRVCRPGGRIGMANWTPEGLIGGGLFATMAKHAPPPPGINPPSLWGTEERLRELFGDGISELRIEPQVVNFRSRSPEHWLEYFRTYFGPMRMAFARVGDDGAPALENDLLEVMRTHNRAGDKALVAPAEYVEVVATRA